MSSQQVTLVFNAILDIQNHESLDEGQLLPALLQRPLTDRDLIHSFAQVLLSACNRTHTDRRNSHSKLPESLSDQDSAVDEKRNTKKARVQTEVRVMPQLATPDPEPELQSSMVSPSNMNSSSDQRDHDGEHTAESDLSPRDPDIIAQSIDDFIQESQDEISYFSSAENSERTYQILSALIDGDAVLGDEPQEEARWTDGAEWLSLLESGRKDRKKGTICYAITAVAFARWHATQVRLLGDEVTSQQASQQVSARILDSHTDGDTKRREKQRKKLNTHLARGRKWLRLVDALGRTNTDTFCNGLKMQELASPQATFTTSFTQLQEIQTSITGSELVVKSTEYRFPITSLHLLDGSQWINQDIILACLHLADRLPFIRVSSFHVALSDQLKDPLQMTRKTVRQWRQEIKKEEHLVSFFPLNHGGSHWSLLEIDDREQRITLYNGSEDYIKDACKKAFPNHKFVYGRRKQLPKKMGITVVHWLSIMQGVGC
ncbi:uncharacterized protein FOBCDRAFT_127216 [Fusarium oxysporum Fo47]|uniref:uncharacterized protein n=1 Tax=Fusarium oxysporum Fo47 TaxID=660027 RepID=UPI002869CFBC|nr:uncharacterized protein FOBCDRAFT_127216 [Fusarium oxysporum Fo47]QKD50461.2 hypothetical protein FOBCDRAFT_127216 [Fusarium oxysporum Fo47]